MTQRKQTWLIFALAWVVTCSGLFFAAERIGRNSAMMQLIDSATTDAKLKTALLNVALERPRALPLVLSGDPDVSAALTEKPGAKQALNEKLEALIPGTEASVIYVTNADGIAIASSNWASPTSFVGVDFTFREYYKVAMLNGQAEHYALGHVSNAPGLYIANRVDDESGNKLGIVVAKVEFPQLESDWRIGRRPVYVTDQNGVVLMTSIPQWRFNTTRPLSEEVKGHLLALRQFGNSALKALPVTIEKETPGLARIVKASLSGQGPTKFLQMPVAVPSTLWTLFYLQPIDETIGLHIREMWLITAAILMPLVALSAYWLHRRHRIEDDRIAAEEDRIKLEQNVQERTRDLTTARDHLAFEVEQRELAETALRQVQHKLVQANRLSILGQVAAGVAHEINQPVATIRTFAENSRKFLERGRIDKADENLLQIANLTERIGTITSDLKILARKGRTAAQPIELKSVIDGAVILLQSRFSGRMDALSIDYEHSETKVLGSQIRLEQIVINLLQNAFEAVDGRQDASVRIYCEKRADEMALAICDNGPGIDPVIREQLFSPFNTSKEGGLGLGLVISSDIAADYGGRINVDTGEDGTCFTVLLKIAEHSA